MLPLEIFSEKVNEINPFNLGFNECLKWGSTYLSFTAGSCLQYCSFMEFDVFAFIYYDEMAIHTNVIFILVTLDEEKAVR
jgi:hypothetical protein